MNKLFVGMDQRDVLVDFSFVAVVSLLTVDCVIFDPRCD
jgi:hypothetical protein